jgi:tetratricopeptide (TPR) repeat protein
MADVFLSYAREDDSLAQELANRLFEMGWHVFWDQGIQSGTNWTDRLHYELVTCDCVVVLWSAASVQSTWVKHEANLGLIRKVLLPVQLDDAEPPPEFRHVQTAEWKERPVPGLERAFRPAIPVWLVEGIARLAGMTPPSLMVDDPRPEAVANDQGLYRELKLVFNMPFEPGWYSALARTMAGILEAGHHRPDKTLRNLHRAARAYFKRGDANALWLPSRSDRKRFQETMDAMKARFIACTTAEEFHRLAEELDEEVPATTAEQYFEQALKETDTDKQIELCSLAIHLKPDYAEALFKRGLARAEQLNNAWAIEDFNDVIRLVPDHVLAYLNRGICREVEGDTVGALEDFNTVIRLNPRDHSGFNYRGWLRAREGDPAEALKDFNKAIQLKPDADADVFNNRALARAALGDLKGARKDYDTAIELRPHDPVAFHWRGYFRMDQGDKIGGRQDLDTAARLRKARGQE